jgi:FixJ family two-component response regulator
LSKREKEIFPLLADGMGVKEIAHKLCISSKVCTSCLEGDLQKIRRLFLSPK